jgi:hypothetical protein
LITAGSVLFAGFVSPRFDTVPIFVIVPVFVRVFAFTVIVERVVPDEILALVVQENELVAITALHVHGATFGTDTSVVHAGRVSVTVVTPVAVAGHSFRTTSV